MIGLAVLLGAVALAGLIVLAAIGFDGALGILVVAAFLMAMFSFGAATRRR